MSGPLPKPTQLRLVESGGKLKARYRKRADQEPKPRAPLGDPPSYLSRDQLEVWFRLEQAAPPELLTGCDREVFESFVVLTAAREKTCALFNASNGQVLVRSHDDQNRLVLNPFLREYKRLSEQLRTIGHEMGMSPAARVRLQLPPPEGDADPLAEFLS